MGIRSGWGSPSLEAFKVWGAKATARLGGCWRQLCLCGPQWSLRANTSHLGAKPSAVLDLNHDRGDEGSDCSLHPPRLDRRHSQHSLGGNLSAWSCGVPDPRGWGAPAPKANVIFLGPACVPPPLDFSHGKSHRHHALSLPTHPQQTPRRERRLLGCLPKGSGPHYRKAADLQPHHLCLLQGRNTLLQEGHEGFPGAWRELITAAHPCKGALQF